MDLAFLREQVIGNQLSFEGPFGKRIMTYADFTASGRTVRFIEAYLQKLSESYANTHTDDSFTGLQMTHLYHQAKDNIRQIVGGNEETVVVSVGSGTTGAIQKLSQILGIYEAPATKQRRKEIEQQGISEGVLDQGLFERLKRYHENKRPVVFISSYEHHSNDLIWREGDCEVVQISLTIEGTFDLEDLRLKISAPQYADRLKIGAFSAGSNVTGMLSPIDEIAQILHEHQGLVFFDFAACGPYVEINVNNGEMNAFDGVYLSPHKFLGGPGASGLLIFKKSIYNRALAPTCAGGGTVKYVSSKSYDFLQDIEVREDAGTPAILQMIKTALVLKLKEAVGVENIHRIEKCYVDQALKRFENHPNIYILGPEGQKERLSIFSFNIRYQEGYLHPRFVTKLLNDLFGIQARAGCSCAGPYGHYLLRIDPLLSEKYRGIIQTGLEVMKPGWIRVNFHYIFEQKTIDFLLDAIEIIADYGYLFLKEYAVDATTGHWQHLNQEIILLKELSLTDAVNEEKTRLLKQDTEALGEAYEAYITFAKSRCNELTATECETQLYRGEDFGDLAWFYYIKQ